MIPSSRGLGVFLLELLSHDGWGWPVGLLRCSGMQIDMIRTRIALLLEIV